MQIELCETYFSKEKTEIRDMLQMCKTKKEDMLKMCKTKKEDIFRRLRITLAGFDRVEKRRLEIYNTGIKGCEDFYWEATDLMDKNQKQIFYLDQSNRTI